jgi:hypothetical protein
MRTDENGAECPETLGEYRDYCAVFGGEYCKAVDFLDEKIAASTNGRDTKVLAADSQMRGLLFPMMAVSKTTKG